MFRERSDKMKTPSLFPCAAKVKVPQLGSEDTSFDLKISHKPSPTSVIFKTYSQPEPVSKNYLKTVSADLTFSEDVVKDRCFHMLPYDEKYLNEVLSPGDLIAPRKSMKIPPGRHDARGTDIRHMPCNLTKSYKPHLKPLKRRIMERAKEMHQEALLKSSMEGEDLESMEENESESGFFLTEMSSPKEKDLKMGKAPSSLSTTPGRLEKSSSEKTEKGKKKVKILTKSVKSDSLTEEEENDRKWNEYVRENYDWDAYTLSQVSSHTAQWIVLEKLDQGPAKDKLQNLVEGWYGRQDSSELLMATLGELKEDPLKKPEKEKKPKKKWKKPEELNLAKVLNMENSEPHAHDPYSDDNKAPFYRQPVGRRRAIKHAEKEDAVSSVFEEHVQGAINATADITVTKSYEPPPPPTIRDLVNPNVGDKFFDTDNKFQQEWLTGAEQRHSIEGDKSKILMTTNNKYQKQLQTQHPKDPDVWYPPSEREKRKSDHTPRVAKIEKGLRRWKDLPQPADDSGEYNMVPPGFDPEFHRSPDPTTRRLTKQNAALLQVIDEWRQKWHLSGQLDDSTPDDLIKDMADIQSHVRLKAIATIAKAAELRPPTQEMGMLNYGDIPSLNPIQQLPEKLFIALECLLDDSVDRVKLAAAITLYSLSRPLEKAKKILNTALYSESGVDRWAAAQCLALDGICNSMVVGEILKQLLNTEDTIKHEKAIYLLGKLSLFSPLVHCMTAEQLNSSSWRHKVIACKILPTLHGTINKDITNKLMDLMWNDWHEDVRKSAGQCLGKTSHGREVHDDLRERILKGDENTRLEAISKIGQLGIMTAKLLPVFLQCFEDEYISVRSEVCITCGNIEIQDEQVLEKLIHLATFDPIWKVKALAIQAMGKIGVTTEEVVETLLWAVRYEENPGVRAESCHTIMVLNLKTEEVAEVLQERFLVESSPLVRDEIAKTLEMFGISATEDMDMVAQIKNEVRKLCTRNNIAGQITLNEADDRKHANMARMIYESEKELKKSINPYRQILLRSEEARRNLHCHFSYSVTSLSYSHISHRRFSKENEAEKEPIMQRLRSMSQASSRPSTPHPKIMVESQASSPTPSREAIVFTPTADEELDKILAKDDVHSSTTTPDIASESPEQKSHGGDQSITSSKEEEGKTPEQVSKMGTISEECGALSRSSQASQSVLGDSTDRELSDKTGERTSPDGDRPTSVVKFAPELKVEEIPGRSRSTLTPSKSALDDMRTSRLSSMGGRTSEVRAFSRDAIQEREKINTEALRSYAGLDSRYSDMIFELTQVDNAFDAITGQEGDEIEKLKNITMIDLPSKSNLVPSDEKSTDGSAYSGSSSERKRKKGNLLDVK